MSSTITALAFVFLALLHLLPAAAAVRPRLLTSLYGAEPGSTAFALLQHRAALFAAVCLVCVWAAFDPATRPAASALCATSMVTFLVIYAARGRPAALRTIALADLAGLPALAVALLAAFFPAALP